MIIILFKIDEGKICEKYLKELERILEEIY